MPYFNESQLEQSIITLLQEQGYEYVKGEDIQRDLDEVVLRDDLAQYLRNRYLHIHPTEEWRVQPNLATPASTRTSTRTSSPVTNSNPNSKFCTNNEDIIELVRVIAYEELSVSQMMDIKKLKHRQSFMEYHLEPALKEKFVRRKYPDRPNHPRQRYLLTVKGLALYNELIKGK